MASDRPGLTADLVIRHVLLGLFLYLLQRYLFPLVPWWGVLAWHGWGLVLLFLFGRKVAPAVLPATAVVVLGLPFLGYRVGLFGPGSGIESFIVRGSYTVLLPAVIALFPLVTEVWYVRFRRHRKYFPLVAAAAIVLLFWSQGHYRSGLFPHPMWYVLIALPAAVLLTGHQILVSGDEMGANRRDLLVRWIAAVPFFLLLIFPVYTQWSRGSIESRGGLIRPSAFHFDFSDYVSLESSISMSRGLVLLYREDSMPADRLIRRFVLSGYEPGRGFFRLGADEEPSPVPPDSVTRAAGGFVTPYASGPMQVAVEQEYYLLNFDPDALLGVHQPVAVSPIPDWDRSSFSSAYRVLSVRPRGTPNQLAQVQWPVVLDREWRRAYLGGDFPDEIAALARNVAPEDGGYYETVVALEEYFLDNFYYSLNPGISPTGDQLSHFLFQSHKGYCSYFAFSMTLMARSLGIPARVVLGFFTDPQSGVLGFYPVRGDMAHAWVEVWFDGIGWVEFDPTSRTLAPGEEFSADADGDGEELAGLVEEILANRRGEKFRPGSPPSSEADSTGRSNVFRNLPKWTTPLFLVLAAISGPLFVYRRKRRLRKLLHRKPRLAADVLYRRMQKFYLRMTRAGIVTGPIDFSSPARLPEPLTEIGDLVDRSRYAETFGPGEGKRLYFRYRAVVTKPPVCSRIRRLFWFVFIRIPAAFLFVVLLFLPVESLPGQPGPDELVESVHQAVDAENYALALERLQEGVQSYPTDYRFPDMAGDLYYREGLFESARASWQEALRRGAPGYAVRYDLSRALGRLNRDAEAISLLERLYREVPEDSYVVDDLAWLYYKQNRLEDARDLLENALVAGGPERDLSMTLATVYAGLYRYDDARAAYRRALVAADPDERYFRSVVHYNESILHARFRVWDEAERSVRRSLEMVERSAGYMMRSELRLQRMDVSGAIADLEQAVQLEEESPLPALALASVRLEAGDPDTAIALVERVQRQTHDGWLYFFGTSPDRYLYQLYSIAADAWEAAARRDSLFRPGSLWQRTSRFVRSTFRRVKGWYYRGLARMQSLSVADEFDSGGRTIQASYHRMVAGEQWKTITLSNMNIAEELEVKRNPAIAGNYQLIRATTTGDVAALRGLLDMFSGPWERYERLQVLVELYDLLGRDDPEALHYAAEAWMLHPGAFLVRGRPVPLNIAEPGQMRTIVRRLGLVHAPESPLTLDTTWNDGVLKWWIFHDTEGYISGGEIISADGISGRLRAAVRYRRVLEELAEELTGGVKVPDGTGGRPRSQ